MTCFPHQHMLACGQNEGLSVVALGKEQDGALSSSRGDLMFQKKQHEHHYPPLSQ